MLARCRLIWRPAKPYSEISSNYLNNYKSFEPFYRSSWVLNGGFEVTLSSVCLQVQLEKIRQSEKELRWQYEEDVDNCGECRQLFNVTKRKVWKWTTIQLKLNNNLWMELIASLPPLQSDLLRWLFEENGDQRTEQKAVACLQRLLLPPSPRLCSILQFRAEKTCSIIDDYSFEY